MSSPILALSSLSCLSKVTWVHAELGNVSHVAAARCFGQKAWINVCGLALAVMFWRGCAAHSPDGKRAGARLLSYAGHNRLWFFSSQLFSSTSWYQGSLYSLLSARPSPTNSHFFVTLNSSVCVFCFSSGFWLEPVRPLPSLLMGVVCKTLVTSDSLVLHLECVRPRWGDPPLPSPKLLYTGWEEN